MNDGMPDSTAWRKWPEIKPRMGNRRAVVLERVATPLGQIWKVKSEAAWPEWKLSLYALAAAAVFGALSWWL